VLTLTFSAFGGPQAHVALMLKMLVEDRRYLSAEEFIELNALCQMLPGPTSTQTITAIGFKRGGALLALITLFTWILPAALIMTILAFAFSFFKTQAISTDFLKYIQPMAVGFIAYAGYRISSTVIKSKIGWGLLIFSTVITYLVQKPFIFPAVLIFGGIVTNFTSKEKANFRVTRPQFKWFTLILFFGILFIAAALGGATHLKPVILFENFYRFGSLVFGGGQVLIPMMYEQFVNHKEFLTSEEFLSGYGIVQALPGPVFSFATFMGGLALADQGTGQLILGCLIGTIGIFLPGTLLIFFVYPFWEYLKKYVVFKRSLEGINAAASGLVVAAAIILFLAIEPTKFNIAIILFTGILNFYKIPAPLLVIMALFLGIMF